MKPTTAKHIQCDIFGTTVQTDLFLDVAPAIKAVDEALPKTQKRNNTVLDIPEGTTPQTLCIEIERHNNANAMAELGFIKMGKSTLAKRKAYVKQLHASLMELTVDQCADADLSDAELLASLGI